MLLQLFLQLRFLYCLQYFPEPSWRSWCQPRFSRAAALLKVSSSWLSVILTLFSFLKFKISVSRLLGHLFTYGHLLLNHQRVRSIVVNSCERSDYSCDGLSLIMSLSIRRGASAYVSVLMWKHCAPHRRLDVMKFTAPPPLSLLLACKLSFPVGLKMSSLLNFALKSLT